MDRVQALSIAINAIELDIITKLDRIHAKEDLPDSLWLLNRHAAVRVLKEMVQIELEADEK